MRKPFPFNNGKDDYSRALNRVTLKKLKAKSNKDNQYSIN